MNLIPEPGAVTELSAVSTSLHSINVTWELPWQPNGPILYYTLFYRPMTTLQTPPIASNGYITQQTETTHWAVIDLEAHTSYAIHVQAIGGDNMAAILPGVIAEEIIVLTAGANSTVAPPTINIPGPGATVSVVIGVTAAIVCVSLIVAASVVVITCVVVRHRRALYKMRYLATSVVFLFFIARISVSCSPSPSISPSLPPFISPSLCSSLPPSLFPPLFLPLLHPPPFSLPPSLS